MEDRDIVKIVNEGEEFRLWMKEKDVKIVNEGEGSCEDYE